MNEISRRSFVGRAIAVGAASAMLGEPAPAQLVWQQSQWKAGDFNALVHVPRRIKQVFDASAIEDGRFLRNVKNSLNGIHYGSGIPMDQIQLVCCLRGSANMMNYDDYVWRNYHLGEMLKITDPKTGAPAARNIFYPSAAGAPSHYASQDPSSDDSADQDASMQALQARGVQFLSCHTSTEEWARGIVKQFKLSQNPEDVAKDMVAHAIPGVLLVPSAAGALALLQCEGRYAYTAA